MLNALHMMPKTKKETLSIRSDSTLSLAKVPNKCFRYGLARVTHALSLSGEDCEGLSFDSPIVVKVGDILGRGLPNRCRKNFQSLGIDAKHDGVSRESLQVAHERIDGSGINVKCIPDSKNGVGIVPWKCNGAGMQWEELKLHGRKVQNDIKYLRPGQSTTVGVNDWLVFDMYRQDPLHIFRLVTVPTPCTTRGGLSLLINQSDDVNSDANVTPTMAHTV
jgi:hypothetical protein